METKEISPELIEKFQNGGADQLANIIEAFNPATAATLPEAIGQLMPHLTLEQIQALAKAYPNKPTGNSYLVLMDKSLKGKQLNPLSTWENLANLRKIAGKAAENMVAFAFRVQFNKSRAAAAIQPASTQDISKSEIAGLPGITSGAEQKAQPITTGQAITATAEQTLQQQAVQQQGTEEASKGAANASNGGELFPEVTIDQIKNDQAASNSQHAAATEHSTSGRTVKTPEQKQAEKDAKKAAKDAEKAAGAATK